MPEQEQKATPKNDNEQFKNISTMEEENLQYNSQDLDQNQHVDLNPLQLNSQNLHIYLNDKKVDYASKIFGTAYFDNNKRAASNISIALCFGGDLLQPIAKTKSDINGNYSIENIPPGFYVIKATVGDHFKYQSGYIKILPCQNINHTILIEIPK